MSIEQNIGEIHEKIAEAARRAGRPAKEIMLVAAAKQNGAENVRAAICAGVDAVGENRVSELLEKDALGAYAGAPLHFIGHLQKNKAKHVVGRAELIHSVDSLELVRLIDSLAARQGIVQKVLVQVNIGAEPSKSGLSPGELDEFLSSAAGFSRIEVAGLMAIPPFDADESRLRGFFSDMYKLYIDMDAKKYDNNRMQYLSMGMSHDYEIAIGEGANIVRIGSAIFGSRLY